MKTRMNRASTATAAALLAGALAACGGSDEGGCRTLDPGRDASLPGCTVTSGLGAAAPIAPLAVTLSDANGAPTTMVSPKAPATAKVMVKDGTGKALAGVAVTLTSTDKTAVLVPASGTALTDAAGVASIGVAAGTQAGAFTLTASATRDGSTATGSASYAVAFPVLTMSAMRVSPTPLPAGGTASLAVTVLEGSTPYAPALEVNFTSPCATAGKATISSPVTTVAGVASTSYIDKGCGAPDLVTASAVLAGATVTASGTVTIETALPGQLGFVSALPQNISLKGTGGAGRQESSIVVFKLLDRNGIPVSGQRVDFELSTSVGGLALNHGSATTGSDGTVSTIVSAGTVNTPVRVRASIAGTTLTTLSDQLIISTGVPDQNSFSLSTEIFNVEGMNLDGCPTPAGSLMTVRLADHFNNPAPDGTAVSFTAEGGTVDASCLTGLVNTTLTDGTVVTQKGIPGSCTVRFCSANPRPADGRVTVLAYALGEESFFDRNGTNLYYQPPGDPSQDPGDPFQDLGEAFRNDRAITHRNAQATWGLELDGPVPLKPRSPDDQWSVGNAQRALGEIFIDSNNKEGWNKTGDGKYNGVLHVDGKVVDPVTHVRGALVQVMSTSKSAIDSLGPQGFTLSRCVNGTPFVNNAVSIRFAIRDTNPTVFAANRPDDKLPEDAVPLQLPFDLPGNILPAGTKIEFVASNGTLLSAPSYTVPNTADPSAALWLYTVQMQSDASQTSPAGIPPLYCSNAISNGTLTVKVTTPSGFITTRSYPVTD